MPLTTGPDAFQSAAPVALPGRGWFRVGMLVAMFVVSLGFAALVGGLIARQMLSSGMASGGQQSMAMIPPEGGSNTDEYGNPALWGTGQRINFDPKTFPARRFDGTLGHPDDTVELPGDASLTEPILVQESAPDDVDLSDLLGVSFVADDPADPSASPDAPSEDVTPPASEDTPPAVHDALFDLGGDAKPAETPAKKQNFILSLGSYTSRADADRLASDLNDKGFSGHVRERSHDDGSINFSVGAGSFTTREEADALARKIRDAGFSVWIVVS
ncbi:MAG: SPOR domain-containing protein [bacterium]